MTADPALHLLGLVPDDLVEALEARAIACSPAEARRVLARLISDGEADPAPRKNTVRRELVEALEAVGRWERPVVEERVEDPVDGSVRYLLRAADGARFEAVRIGLHKPGRYTVCLSSQAGCAMACAFCATGRLGLGRSLTAAEIVGQWLVVRDEAPGRVTGAVFMGQGEPLHAYDAVVQAAAVLSHPCGGRIGADAISISTVGLVPQIRRYTREVQPYRLVVSLTSTVPERRARLLPVAGKLALDDLVDALREHVEALRARTRRGTPRITVAWVLMGGVNHDAAEVEGLRRLAAELPLRINLIDVNDARPDGFRRATDAEREAFRDELHRLGVPIVRRYSVGRATHSACGMLALRRRTAPADPPARPGS